MQRRRFLMKSMGLLACGSTGLQFFPWQAAVGAEGSGGTPTVAELKRIVASTGGRGGKIQQGPKGGSFRPNLPKGGKINPEGQYLGELQLVNVKTGTKVSEQIVLRVVEGKVQMFHLVGNTVLAGRNVRATRDGVRGEFSVSWDFIDIGPLSISINSDGSMTYTLDLGPVNITYTTDPPPPSTDGGLGGPTNVYAY